MEKTKASSSSLEELQTRKRRRLQEAKDLILHLQYDEEIQALKQRWLMRRWPEYPEICRSDSQSPSKLGFLMDRYIPESLLRNDNSAVAMKTDIQRGFDMFEEESERVNQSQQFKLEVSEMQLAEIQGLPDKEIFGSLPLFFKHLKLSALRTLANVVTGKKYRSTRYRTIRKIKRGLSTLFSQTGENASECLHMALDILRNPSNIHLSSFALTQMASSWPEAAKSTLYQLEKFPIHTLYVMKRMLKRVSVGSKGAGVNRSSVAKRVKQLGWKFLRNAQECDPIPEPLKKALLVASLSARQIFGTDGGLLQSLGPISRETNALNNDFLKAISHVQKLQHGELKDVYSCLYSDRSFPSIRCRVLQHKIRMLLIDSLLESCDRTIPEPVMRCMIMINRLGAEKEEAKRKTNPKSYNRELRVEVESDCVLNVSSHLQQIIWDWTEQAGIDQGWTELHLDESEETCEQWFTDNSYNSFTLAGDGEAYVGESTWDPEFAKDEDPSLKEHETKTFEGQELKYSSEEDTLRRNGCLREEKGIDILQQIQGISDETSLFAYQLLGCMIDEFLIRQGDVLEAPAQAYLRTGLPATVMDTGDKEPFNYQEDMDISMLLNIAEKLLPQMPGSVIENVKLSLGPLKWYHLRQEGSFTD